MAKLRRDKIALFLACATFLGGKVQAAQNVKTGQTVTAVGGARNQPKKINWKKIAKIVGLSTVGLVVLETIHSLIGGFTDSKVGSYSVGRAIRDCLNKNNQLVPDDKMLGDDKLNISGISNISLHGDDDQNDYEALKKEISLMGGKGGKLDEKTATPLEQVDDDFEEIIDDCMDD